MKDRNGKDVKVGDRVYVLPSKKDERDGGPGYVRIIKPSLRLKSQLAARIDDGAPGDFDITKSTEWTWSAWCGSAEFELIS